MKEVTFSFRPMPNLEAGSCLATITTHREFVEIDAIPGHPIFLTGAVAHIVCNALREARNELRSVEVLR